ncbi:MAG: hypothetical protein ACOCXQ_03905 [Patescibacteria group bacterium]
MAYKRKYGGIIWTNHAIERLHQRKLPQHIAYLAFQSPDTQIQGKQPGAVELQKKYKNSYITLITKKNEQDEWLVLSAWIDPPLPGTDDYRKREHWRGMQKAGFWGKIWLTFKKQIGL